MIHPKGPVDLSAYKLDPQFVAWIEQAINTRYKKVSRDAPTLTVWHINQSEFKPSDKQYLLTFLETSNPTDEEVNIVNQQDHTFLSSSWAVDNLKTYGAQNVSFVPLGFDPDFHVIPERLTDPATTQWTLIGKAEARKNTELIIRTWVKKYGGNGKHFLNLLVNNPFFKPEQMAGFYQHVLNGNKPFNVNILPALKTNAEVNRLHNATDIDLSGFSKSEGWGLPSFMATALGKWSIVTDCTAHKDWANAGNAIMVEPQGMDPCYDGMFFAQGQQFNQGNFFKFGEDQLVAAMEKAERVAKTPNLLGTNLQTQFTYERTVNEILAKIAP